LKLKSNIGLNDATTNINMILNDEMKYKLWSFGCFPTVLLFSNCPGKNSSCQGKNPTLVITYNHERIPG